MHTSFLELPHDSSTRETVSTLLYTYRISQSNIIIIWRRKWWRAGGRSKNVAVYPKVYRYNIAYYQNKLYSGEYFGNKITAFSYSHSPLTKNIPTPTLRRHSWSLEFMNFFLTKLSRLNEILNVAIFFSQFLFLIKS